MNTIGTHEIDPITDRNDDLLGAFVFLTPDEVETLTDKGAVTIEAE
ncbi:MAG: hypothetical protein ABEI52_07780 [Halobacteriaceae archaeon]